MNLFKRLHPVTLAVYFILVTGLTMFVNQPVLLMLSLCGSFLFVLLLSGRDFLAYLPYTFLLLLGAAVINPMINHNGTTILFFLNQRAITKEALVYGCFMAVMLAAVLFWFQSLSHLMTSDKWLFLFGTLTPRLALVLSMALRYIPLFRLQFQKITQTQKAMGAINEDSYRSKGAGSLKVFSIMVTWSLENAIDTADSMRARGFIDHHRKNYQRSRFNNYRFRKVDVIMLGVSLILTGITAAGIMSGTIEFTYYPVCSKLLFDRNTMISYTAFGILVLFPAVMEIKERVQWIYYKSGM